VGQGTIEHSSQSQSSSSSASGGEQPGSGQSRSKLVQRLLEASNDLPQFLNDLLTTQAVVVAGTEAAGFLVERQPGKPGEDGAAAKEEKMGLRPVAHIRPDESDHETRQAALRAFQNLIVPCVQQNKDGAIEVGSPDGGEPQFCLITLLKSEGQVVAVSAVITRCRDLERARQRLGSMQLVAGYFELFTLKRVSEHSRQLAQRHQHVLQYASAVGTAEGFASSAMNLCNEMANRAGASRVTLGWLKGRYVRVKALAHTEKFDKKQDLIVQLERVMEECFDQEEPVYFNVQGESSPNVTRNAKAFSQLQGGVSVLSLPMRHKDEVVGVMTLEFPAQASPDQNMVEGLAVATELLSPQLYDRFHNDRNIFVKMGISVREGAKLVIGRKHMVAKLVVVAVLGAAAFVTFFRPMYHVNASFVLEPKDKRQLCAPFEGFLKTVNYKPGVPIKAGAEIATFDTRELRLQQNEARAEAEGKQKEFESLRVDEKKQAEAKIAEAEYRRLQARVEFIGAQIERHTLVAPFDCIILKGDLVDQVGSPKKEGEVLFEIARVDPERNDRIAIEAKMQVSDRDIQEVRRALERDSWWDRSFGTGHGKIATTSFPDDKHSFAITRVVPVGEPKEGENLFSVYADVKDPPAWMHPGLAGEGRVRIEQRRLVWVWTHRLVDFIRLKVWI